jgi:hypothetical protein
MIKNDYEKLQRRFRDLEKKSERAEREGFNRAMETLAKKQRDAVETGDTEAFDAAEKERKKLEKEQAEQKAEPVDVEQRQEEFIEWRADNLWYGENKLLTDYADTAAEKMMKDKGGFLGPDDLAALARKVKDRFGDKFPDAFGVSPKKDDDGEDDKPRRRSPVEGVSSARGKGGPKTAADLDARAKDVGTSLVKMGLYKDLNEYAKDLYK